MKHFCLRLLRCGADTSVSRFVEHIGQSKVSSGENIKTVEIVTLFPLFLWLKTIHDVEVDF